MEHRHLNHSDYTLAAIDDVIGRGKLVDWVQLRRAAERDHEMLGRIERICLAHTHDPCEQRYHLWLRYARTRPAMEIAAHEP